MVNSTVFSGRGFASTHFPVIVPTDFGADHNDHHQTNPQPPTTSTGVDHTPPQGTAVRVKADTEHHGTMVYLR